MASSTAVMVSRVGDVLSPRCRGRGGATEVSFKCFNLDVLFLGELEVTWKCEAGLELAPWVETEMVTITTTATTSATICLLEAYPHMDIYRNHFPLTSVGLTTITTITTATLYLLEADSFMDIYLEITSR